MKIRLIMRAAEEPMTVECDERVTILQLLEEYKDQLEYTPMYAKVNGVGMHLRTELVDGDVVEPIDARRQTGNMVYQHTLSMIFLKAVRSVLGEVPVIIQNPLNKGLFIRIDSEEPVADETLATVSGLMREYIRRDRPIEEVFLNREEAIETLTEYGHDDKVKLLTQSPEIREVSFYKLGDYMNSFYGILAPSAGYVDKFELSRYRDGYILKHPYTDNPNVLPESRDDNKLYEAFETAQKWNKLMGVEYLADLNAKIMGGDGGDLVLLSEALHEKRIAEVADQIKESGKRIVLVAGPSSSGKTSFAKRLCVQLRVIGVTPLYMGTDDYFVEREETPIGEDGKPDYENLGAMDIELFNNNMNDLLSGKEVDMPTFNFMTGSKEFGKRITKLQENMVMVIEGIHALNEAMSSHINEEDKFKIYISPLTQLNIDSHNRISNTDARKLRRMVRDYKFRGHSAERTIDDWPKVRAGEDKNIFPYNGEADVLFNSVTIYELAVLKKYAQPLLEEVSENRPEYAEAQRLIQFLKYFKPLSDEDERFIPNNSLIREFIGGSVLV